MRTLKGLTWNHDRGLAPLLATAREFHTLHPNIAIEWEARSLHEFGDVSVAGVADRYDMIVIDHPFMGDAAREGFLLSLDELLPAETLATLRAESAGPSHDTYDYSGHQWALAIDAAAQFSGYRADLLEAAGVTVPRTWDDVFKIAEIRPGFVTAALLPLDTTMCFFGLCADCGEAPMQRGDSFVGRSVGENALERLRRLAALSHPAAREWNPIAVWERMSTTDEIGYCPLAFGYSNYARNGYRPSRVTFTNVPASPEAVGVGSTLGGAGLAITKRCSDVPAAAEYAAWVASAACQRGTYLKAGGQPGNRVAWTDAESNALTSGFFTSTIDTLERAYVRPRFAGFVDFQTAAAKVLTRFLGDASDARGALEELEGLWERAERC